MGSGGSKPVDCICDGVWIDKTACSHTCGGGQRTQTQRCTEATGGGKPCSSLQLPPTRTVACNQNPCPIDCTCSPDSWYDFVSCDKTCGGGSKKQKLVCTEAKYGGKSCVSLNLPPTRSVVCNELPCPVDCFCNADSWFDSVSCDKACGMYIHNNNNNNIIQLRLRFKI